MKIGYFATFAVGAAIGSVAAWHLAKSKYEQIAQEEIDSVKAVFSSRKREEEGEGEPAQDEDCEEDPRELADKAKDKPDISEYARKIAENGYTEYSVAQPKAAETGKPYVITPEEFGELDGYSTISLTYYADQHLAYENDELVEDVDDVVGVESLSTFGQYEDDSVFVRNDRLRVDYEILLDQGNYADVLESKPYLAEG